MDYIWYKVVLFFWSITSISGLHHARFGLAADVQVINPKGEGRTLYQSEHVSIGRRMTMVELVRHCRRIAKVLGAELDGMVNINLVSTGGDISFDMMAEVQ